MVTRHMTLSDVDRLALEAETGSDALAMDEDAFRVFYEQTARGLWAYLSRATGDAEAANDLLQESYYRLLRTTTSFETEAHRRHYLFRIAANLLRDRRRRPSREVPLPDPGEERSQLSQNSLPAAIVARRDVSRALVALRPRDRDLLWFAYAQGMTHSEIAAALGVKSGSVRMLLFRARAKLLARLTRTVQSPTPGGSK
jgi:RNA polymerase sigma-70 factor (ECF subfamily)